MTLAMASLSTSPISPTDVSSKPAARAYVSAARRTGAKLAVSLVTCKRSGAGGVGTLAGISEADVGEPLGIADLMGSCTSCQPLERYTPGLNTHLFGAAL